MLLLFHQALLLLELRQKAFLFLAHSSLLVRLRLSLSLQTLFFFQSLCSLLFLGNAQSFSFESSLLRLEIFFLFSHPLFMLPLHRCLLLCHGLLLLSK